MDMDSATIGTSYNTLCFDDSFSCSRNGNGLKIGVHVGEQQRGGFQMGSDSAGRGEGVEATGFSGGV